MNPSRLLEEYGRRYEHHVRYFALIGRAGDALADGTPSFEFQAHPPGSIGVGYLGRLFSVTHTFDPADEHLPSSVAFAELRPGKRSPDIRVVVWIDDAGYVYRKNVFPGGRSPLSVHDAEALQGFFAESLLASFCPVAADA